MADLLRVQIAALGAMGVVLVAMIVERLLHYSAVPASLGFCSIALGLMMCWVACRAAIARSRGNSANIADASPENQARIQIVGAERHRRLLYDSPDVSFVPRVFNGSWAVPLVKVGGGWRGWMVALLAFGAGSLSCRIVLGQWINDGVLPFFWAALLMGWAIEAWFFPTVLRIMPGRMDVLTFSPFGKRGICTREFDLNRAQIRLDLHQWVIAIDGEKEREEFSICLVPRRMEFVEALLLGAISTRTTPMLPDEELVG